MSSGYGHCHPIILTIYCASCSDLLGSTGPKFPYRDWHNYEEPYCLDPEYPRSSAPRSPYQQSSDSDSDLHTDDGFKADRNLLGALLSMGLSTRRATNALHATSNRTVDRAMGWLDRHPAIPKPDPEWSRWHPMRHCSYVELADPEAKRWIRAATIKTINETREATRSICCKEITHAGAMMRLSGDAVLFTVRYIPVARKLEIRSSRIGKQMGRMLQAQEDEQMAKAIRRNLGI